MDIVEAQCSEYPIGVVHKGVGRGVW